jgi:hypothetical protein
LRSDGGSGAMLVFVNVEGITDIFCVKNHVQVTCVWPRLMLTMEMDGGGEIERN